ncbi:MAG: helix-turn-helix domain-containing protein [Alphaproteobacteria bacterium]|jgi:transcriptional regulator with XRE-family HTH domain
MREPTPDHGIVETTKKRSTTKETSAFDKFVGERIRLYRTMLGVNQQKLAESIGVTFQQLQKYERGENRIGAGRLLNIAIMLGIPITWLLDEQAFAQHHAGGSPGEFQESELMREGYHLGRAFSRISDPELRRSITTLVQSLVQQENEF